MGQRQRLVARRPFLGGSAGGHRRPGSNAESLPCRKPGPTPERRALALGGVVGRAGLGLIFQSEREQLLDHRSVGDAFRKPPASRGFLFKRVRLFHLALPSIAGALIWPMSARRSAARAVGITCNPTSRPRVFGSQWNVALGRFLASTALARRRNGGIEVFEGDLLLFKLVSPGAAEAER